MAEFCLNCWNKVNETDDKASKYILSEELYLCEGCNEWKNVIVEERRYYYLNKFYSVFRLVESNIFYVRTIPQIAA